MRNKIFCFVLLIVSISLSQDFHGYSWFIYSDTLLTMEKMKKVGDTIFQGNRHIQYKDSICGYKCKVSFIFNDKNQLIKGNISFEKSARDKYDYLIMVRQIEGDLTKKYGNSAGNKSSILMSTNTWKNENTSISATSFKPEAGFINIFNIEYEPIKIVSPGL